MDNHVFFDFFGIFSIPMFFLSWFSNATYQRKFCLLSHENIISCLTFVSIFSIPMFFLARFYNGTFQKKTLFDSKWIIISRLTFVSIFSIPMFFLARFYNGTFQKKNFVYFYMEISFILWLLSLYFGYQCSFCLDSI